MTCRFRQSSNSVTSVSFLKKGLRAAFAALTISFVSPALVLAQASSFSLPTVPVLTIVPDRLYSDTVFGQRLSTEIAARSRRLQAENRRIEKELEEEETELTGLRDTYTPEEFRDLADAFDIKVTKARNEQAEKARALSQLSDQVQRAFIGTIAPILENLMSEKGASVVLDRRAVFASADASDVTQEAIEGIDAALGEGRSIEELITPSEQTQEIAPDQ